MAHARAVWDFSEDGEFSRDVKCEGRKARAEGEARPEGFTFCDALTQRSEIIVGRRCA
jgi:hypothetical protein